MLKKSLKTKIIIIDIVIILIAMFVCVFYSKVFKIIQTNVQNNVADANTLVTNWDLNKVNIEYDSTGTPVPVPKGYTISGVTGENTINRGLVIYEGESPVNDSNSWEESINRNQWVWVPVPDINRIYSETPNGIKSGKGYNYRVDGRDALNPNSYNTKEASNYEPGTLKEINSDTESIFSRKSMQGMTRDRLYQELQVEFEATIESIKKYGGFYIGRYETGNMTQKIPVIKRMATTGQVEGSNTSSWYEMYNKMKYLGANNNVDTNMIWGCLWDETVQWFVDSGIRSYAHIWDSRGWGNYSTSTFDYIDSNGNTVHKVGGTAGTNSRIIPTGSSEYTKANNIYDMAGNLYDWTLEAHATVDGTLKFQYRSLRGGVYNTDMTVGHRFDVSDRSQFGSARSGHEYQTVRAYLYIK